MMDEFSKAFQRTHDIDWFAKSGDFYIHAMSFGGMLPNVVNNRSRNFNIMKRVYLFLPVLNDVELEWNEGYLQRRLIRQGDKDGDYVRRRERYLIHFNEMARRGLYSFDRDLQDETIYHLIVKPRNLKLKKWYRGVIPEIADGSFRWESENDCLMRIEI